MRTQLRKSGNRPFPSPLRGPGSGGSGQPPGRSCGSDFGIATRGHDACTGPVLPGLRGWIAKVGGRVPEISFAQARQLNQGMYAYVPI